VPNWALKEENMDRIEAHELLIKEMNELVGRAQGRQAGLDDAPIAIELSGASGVLYTLELQTHPLSGEKFAISGKIHDNNTFQFSLLEERLEFEIGAEKDSPSD